ncbi:MAG: hypothetical protein ACXVXC_17295 [Nocardioidaceae bacterium]
MRSEWVPVSAAALVVGVMALVFGSLLNPASGGESAAQTLHVVDEQGARWIGMSVMFFLSSVGMVLGLPAILSLFIRTGRRLGTAGVAVFAVGVVGLCGYAMLMVFFRAVANTGVLAGNAQALDKVSKDPSLLVFLYGWIGGFVLGIVLIAIALLRARKVPLWVPIVMLVYVVSVPFGSHLGRLGQTVQVLALAVAFTGIAIGAVSADNRRDLIRESIF